MNEIFEKMNAEMNQEVLNEIVTITSPTNIIVDYPTIEVKVNGSSIVPVVGALQEHNPPHFHLVTQEYDVSVSLPDYRLIKITKDVKSQFKNTDKPNWEASGQMKLKRALLKWIGVEINSITNEQDIFQTWNMLNRGLKLAQFNYEQTKKFIQLYLTDESAPSRGYLIKSMLKHNFIDQIILLKVLADLEIK